MSFGRKVARRQRRKELKRPGVGGLKMKCTEHGTKPFLGDLYCSKCLTIHLIDDETKDHPTIVDRCCPCGAAMFPVKGEDGEIMEGVPFFGRPVCRDCARRDHAKQQEDLV